MSVAVMPMTFFAVPNSSAMASTLAAVVVVLVQFVHDETVEPAAVPLLDIRAERIPPARAARREISVRILVK